MSAINPKQTSEEWREATPPGLRRYANEYDQVAKDALEGCRDRLPESQRHHSHVPFAIYYNFLHAIELALKSYMAHTGSDLGELKRVGHDLEKALNICIDKGIRDNCPKLTDLLVDTIKYASSTYKNKEFEYIRVGHIQLGHIDQIAMASSALLAGIGNIEMQPANPE